MLFGTRPPPPYVFDNERSSPRPVFLLPFPAPGSLRSRNPPRFLGPRQATNRDSDDRSFSQEEKTAPCDKLPATRNLARSPARKKSRPGERQKEEPQVQAGSSQGTAISVSASPDLIGREPRRRNQTAATSSFLTPSRTRSVRPHRLSASRSQMAVAFSNFGGAASIHHEPPSSTIGRAKPSCGEGIEGMGEITPTTKGAVHTISRAAVQPKHKLAPSKRSNTHMM
nr:unnamed protein product [Digitaria exilis]